MGDRLNEGMPCITNFVFLHVIPRRSQMFLTFSRHQIMCNVSYVALCTEVTYKGYFAIQQQSKVQNQALDLMTVKAS